MLEHFGKRRELKRFSSHRRPWSFFVVPAFASALGITGEAAADGFVMAMLPNGTLVAQQPKEAWGLRTGDEARFPASEAGRASRAHRRAPLLAPAATLALIEDTALRYGAHEALRAAGLPVTGWVSLFRANVEVESGYDPAARSSAGALGLGQLMPATAVELGVDPHDPVQNLDGSARYLLAMLDRFGEPSLALAAYNAGPDAVARHGGIPPFPETQAHVRKVLAAYARLNGASS